MIIKQSIVEAKFQRAKLATEHTFLWKELPIKYKSTLEGIISFERNEHPIICFYESADYLWIITDIKLIIIENGMIGKYSYSGINKIELSDLLKGGSTKTNNRSLTIRLADDSSFKIRTEEKTWPAIYNILRFIVNAS